MSPDSVMEEIIPAKIPVLGVGVTHFRDYDHAIEVVGQLIEARTRAFIAAVNPEKIYKAQSKPALMEVLEEVDLAICDGIGAAWAVRVLTGRTISRITGVSLFYELVSQAPKNKWRIFLLGASGDVNEAAREKLLSDYPGLLIVGNQDGFFESSAHVVRTINDAKADIVFVAMGSPKQEVWIRQHWNEIDAAICMGVGGTFDVVSGVVKWAPRVFRDTGTEWLYRLIREPKRIRRQLVLPKFVWMVMKHKMETARKKRTRQIT